MHWGGLLDTRWGRQWVARLGLIVALVTVSRLGTSSDRGRLWVGLGVGAFLTLFTSLNGHSGSTPPVWLSLTIDWLHLGATVAWVGGLFTLVFAVLPRFRSWPEADVSALLGPIVRRFSILALVSVELLVVTGLYHTWAHVEGPAELVSEPYGVSLLVKLGLALGLSIPGAFNHFVVRPALARDKTPAAPEFDRLTRRFILSLGAESAVAVLVLAAVGMLTALPPANSTPQLQATGSDSRQPAVTLAQNAGPLLVTLALDPAAVGSNRLRVTVQDERGNYLQDNAVRVRLLPDKHTDAVPSSTTMAVDGDGFRAIVNLSPAGRWRLRVLAQRPSGTADSATFELRVPVYGAAELLAFADETMNRLRSVVEEEDVSTGETSMVARSVFVAPNRFHRRERNPGDAEEVVIGETRHMKHGSMWHTESVPPLVWPAYRFTHHATDVLLIGRDSIGSIEAFVVGFVDTEDGSRNRLWISTDGYRVIQHTSMAPGRFVQTSFSAFNESVSVRKPY